MTRETTRTSPNYQMITKSSPEILSQHLADLAMGQNPNRMGGAPSPIIPWERFSTVTPRCCHVAKKKNRRRVFVPGIYPRFSMLRARDLFFVAFTTPQLDVAIRTGCSAAKLLDAFSPPHCQPILPAGLCTWQPLQSWELGRPFASLKQHPQIEDILLHRRTSSP